MATRPVNTDLDFLSVNRPVNVPDPVNPQDAATKAYVDNAVEGLAWKDSCRVSTISNIDLATPGATIDSITMVLSDRVLVKEQSDASENGIYYWNGASAAMTRTDDANTSDELEQAIVSVEDGTNAGASFRQTAIDFTLDTDDVVWESFGAAVPSASETTPGKIEIATQGEVDAGVDTGRAVTPATLANSSLLVGKYAATFGDGSNTSYAITHNLGTRDVVCSVRLAGSPYDEVICEIEATDTNTVTVKVGVAPASNAYRIMVVAL